MHLTGTTQGKISSTVVFWLVLAVSQVNLPCAALVFLPSTLTCETTATTPRGCACCSSRTRRLGPVPATSRHTRRRCRAFLSEAFYRNTRAFEPKSSRVIASLCPLFRAADAAADGDHSGYRRTEGTPHSSVGCHSTETENYAPVDAHDLEAETQQLLSMPTIDIKLELQMRGVEHRDLFEKVELARRLAESRASSSCPGGASAPPGRAWERARDRFDCERTSSDSDNGDRGSSGSRPRGEPAERGTSPSSAADGAPGGEEVDKLHAQDVSRAMRMGKQAVTRELNAMGIEHSRLSGLSFLAQQYANGRREARAGAGEASWSLPEPVYVEKASEEARSQRGKDSSWERWTWWNGVGWDGGGGTDLPRTLRRPREGDLDDGEEGDGVTVRLSNSHGWVPLVGGFTDAVESQDEKENDGGVMDGSEGENVREAPGSRKREAFLRARADRMSSIELMRALDDLGERYGIPAPRSELQKAFVLAVLGSGNGASDGREIRGGERRKSDIVPLAPYIGEEEGVDGEFREVDWDSYNSALRWARELTFDDLLEELRSRGVQHNPKDNYDSLVRALADEVLADEQLLEDGTKGVDESEVDNIMAMSAQEIIRALREGGEQADVTASQEELARKLVAMKLRDRRASRDGTDGSQEQNESDPIYGETGIPYRPRRRGGRRRGEGGVDSSGRKSRPGRSGLGGGIDDWLRLGDDAHGRGGDDALVELEEAMRAVGGGAWRTAKQTGSFFAETAAGLFPEAFPEEETAGAPEMVRGAAAERGQSRGGGEASPTQPAVERARTARQRAEAARRAAASFAQSSVNRAGLAVVRSVANGVLLGAEAAADWAGGGALAREYVLLFIAAFCLVFKRGIGASIALLFFVRAGRITLQRLEPVGHASERSRAATGGARSAPGCAGISSTAAASGHRGTPDERKERRRPRQSRVVGAQRARANTATGSSRARRAKAKEGSSERRRPLWDESDDDSDRGCLVM